MCLAIPMRVKSINGETGIVETGGMEYSVNLSLLPETAIGDFVIVHTGFAIQKLDQIDAQETLKLFKELIELDEADRKAGE